MSDVFAFFEYMQVWWTSSLKPTFLQPSNDMIFFNLFSSFNIYLIEFYRKNQISIYIYIYVYINI